MKPLSPHALALLFCLALAACNASPADNKPTCTAIMEQCHPVDFGPGDVHDCHLNSETLWNEGQCQANASRCGALCVAPSDAGAETSTDAGSGG